MQRKRRAPRRPLRRRRVYGKRSTRRNYRRYSRYPRRVKGPALPPKRFSNTRVWNKSGQEYAFRVDKSVPFDTYTDSASQQIQGVRQSNSHKMEFPIMGDNPWQREGNRIFIHGLRLTFKIHSEWTSMPSWQDGEIHMALVQFNHPGLDQTYIIDPSFSCPIGAGTNDVQQNQYLSSDTIGRADAIRGKLRHPDYNVITHRKFYVTKKLSTENRWFNKDVQFYLPIKKSVAFQSNSDTFSTKPFQILMWYIPHSNRHEASTVTDDQKYIYVDNFRYVWYFKNIQ